MASREPIELKRHYSELSEKDTDAVVGILADLIVTYLKNKNRTAAGNGNETQETQEVQA